MAPKTSLKPHTTLDEENFTWNYQLALKKKTLQPAKIRGVINCRLKIEMVPKHREVFLRLLQKKLKIKSVRNNGEPKDFKIICEDNKEFHCYKSDLIRISDVFRTLLQRNSQKFTENQNNSIHIKDSSTSAIKTLTEILDPRNSGLFSMEDFNSELLFFADRYNIQALYELCSLKLGLYLNDENILEIALAATMLNDEDLLNQIKYYVMMNNDLMVDENWIAFMAENS